MKEGKTVRISGLTAGTNVRASRSRDELDVRRERLVYPVENRRGQDGSSNKNNSQGREWRYIHCIPC